MSPNRGGIQALPVNHGDGNLLCRFRFQLKLKNESMSPNRGSLMLTPENLFTAKSQSIGEVSGIVVVYPADKCPLDTDCFDFVGQRFGLGKRSFVR